MLQKESHRQSTRQYVFSSHACPLMGPLCALFTFLSCTNWSLCGLKLLTTICFFWQILCSEILLCTTCHFSFYCIVAQSVQPFLSCLFHQEVFSQLSGWIFFPSKAYLKLLIYVKMHFVPASLVTELVFLLTSSWMSVINTITVKCIWCITQYVKHNYAAS